MAFFSEQEASILRVWTAKNWSNDSSSRHNSFALKKYIYIPGHPHAHAHTEKRHSYRHKLGTGADKLSEAEQEVLFSWENLGQLDREMTRKWKLWERKMVGWYAGREKLETGELFVSNIPQMDKPDINNKEPQPQRPNLLSNFCFGTLRKSWLTWPSCQRISLKVIFIFFYGGT